MQRLIEHIADAVSVFDPPPTHLNRKLNMILRLLFLGVASIVLSRYTFEEMPGVSILFLCLYYSIYLACCSLYNLYGDYLTFRDAWYERQADKRQARK